MCGTEEVGIEDEEVIDTKDEIPEAIGFPPIKTEEVIDTKDGIPEGISFQPMETEQENGNYKFLVKTYQHCTSYTVFWSIGVMLWKVCRIDQKQMNQGKLMTGKHHTRT